MSRILLGASCRVWDPIPRPGRLARSPRSAVLALVQLVEGWERKRSWSGRLGLCRSNCIVSCIKLCCPERIGLRPVLAQ